MAYLLTEVDREVMSRAQSLETGGMAAFTAHYFSPINGVPRPDLIGRPPDEYDLDAGKNEYVPWIPLPWQLAVAHDSRLDVTIIGGFGCGKTTGIGAVFLYWCAMMPGFKALNCAPRGWQAKQMYDAIRKDLANWDNRDTDPTYISRAISRVIEAPYPKIELWNGSVIEFMSAEKQGQKIRSWSGDVICIDEAGLLEELTGEGLDDLLVSLGSRVRGAGRGRARLGKIIVMSNADYNPEVWDRFDMAETSPQHYMSLLITTYDNPYLTKDQVAAMERRIRDPDKRDQMLLAKRPMPRGREFTPELLKMAEDESLDALMHSGLDNDAPDFRLDVMERAGIVLWELPPSRMDNYILVGDPGQGTPPYRNSAVAMVFKVTGFPKSPCSLAAFAWIDGRGSYWPFIDKIKEYYHKYRPIYTAFDSTGSQKMMNELAFTQADVLAEGLNFSNLKQAFVLSLKLIMGKGLILMPKEIKGIWHQLSGWHMPDKKLRQDIASTLFMAGYVLNRLFTIDVHMDDSEDESSEIEVVPGQRVPRQVRRRPARTKAWRKRHGTDATGVRRRV